MDWDAALKQASSAPEKPPAPPPEGGVKQGGQFAVDALARALGQFAGWPVDTATNILNLGIAAYGSAKGALTPEGKPADLPELIKNAPGGSQQITQGFRNIANAAIGSPTEGVAPNSPGQRFAGDVTEMMGGALSLGGPKNVAQLNRAIPATIGAVAGGNAAEKVMPDSPAAQITGQLLGGVVVPSSAQGRMQGLQELTAKGKQMMGGAADKAVPVAESVIDKTIKAHAAGYPEAGTNIDEALRLQEKFPGLNLSLAEMTGAPGLSDMQAKYASLRPENLNREASRQLSNQSALEAAFEARTPNAGGASPNEPRNAVNRSIAEREAAVQAEREKLAKTLPDQSQRETGQKLIDLANTERKDVKEKVIRPAYKAAFEAAGDTKINAENVVKEAEAILERKLSDFAPDSAPQSVRALKRLVPDKTKVTSKGEVESVKQPQEGTLEQLDDVRKAINADIANAKNSMGPMADSTLHNLYRLHGAIDEAVKTSALPESAKAAYADALKKYREDYAPRFKEGVPANIFRQTSLHETKLNPDDVVKTFFQPGGEREAGQFVKLMGKNPEAMPAMQRGIQDLYRQKVIDPQTGDINPVAHQRFMAQYARPMEILDKAGGSIRQTLSATGAKAQELAGVSKELDTQAKMLSFNTVDDMKKSLLADPMRLGIALKNMTPTAKQALARSVVEDAWKAGPKMGEYLTQNERTIKMAMGAAEGSQTAIQHFADLKDIARTVEIISRADVKGRLGGGRGNDPLRAATGVSIPTVWSQTRAVAAGRQGVGTAIAMVSGPALTRLSQIQFDTVMNTALHDPKTALALKQYLQAGPTQANSRASELLRVWDAAKSMAKKAPGLTAKYFFGIPSYGGNLARIAPGLQQGGLEAANEQ